MHTEIPVILISHGPFAEGALACAEMLIGKQNNVAALALMPETNINDARDTLTETYRSLNQGQGVVILVDMLGGSPCNIASELLLTHNDILLYCGFNIPTLLEVFNNRDATINDIAQVIEEVFTESCLNVGNLLRTQRAATMDL